MKPPICHRCKKPLLSVTRCEWPFIHVVDYTYRNGHLADQTVGYHSENQDVGPTGRRTYRRHNCGECEAPLSKRNLAWFEDHEYLSET